MGVSLGAPGWESNSWPAAARRRRTFADTLVVRRLHKGFSADLPVRDRSRPLHDPSGLYVNNSSGEGN